MEDSEALSAFFDKDGNVLWIKRPVKVELEAGCIADLLVKTGGPAVVFEQPELSDGSICENSASNESLRD